MNHPSLTGKAKHKLDPYKKKPNRTEAKQITRKASGENAKHGQTPANATLKVPLQKDAQINSNSNNIKSSTAKMFSLIFSHRRSRPSKSHSHSESKSRNFTSNSKPMINASRKPEPEPEPKSINMRRFFHRSRKSASSSSSSSSQRTPTSSNTAKGFGAQNPTSSAPGQITSIPRSTPMYNTMTQEPPIPILQYQHPNHSSSNLSTTSTLLDSPVPPAPTAVRHVDPYIIFIQEARNLDERQRINRACTKLEDRRRASLNWPDDPWRGGFGPPSSGRRWDYGTWRVSDEDGIGIWLRGNGLIR